MRYVEEIKMRVNLVLPPPQSPELLPIDGTLKQVIICDLSVARYLSLVSSFAPCLCINTEPFRFSVRFINLIFTCFMHDFSA